MFLARYILMALLVAGSLTAVAFSAPAAAAQGSQIESAKTAGVIGERIDGYLGIVEDGAVDASLRRRVNEVNAKRRAVYDEVAEQNGATTEQVARLTGEKQIARAAAGQFVMNETGRWTRKP